MVIDFVEDGLVQSLMPRNDKSQLRRPTNLLFGVFCVHHIAI